MKRTWPGRERWAYSPQIRSEPSPRKCVATSHCVSLAGTAGTGDEPSSSSSPIASHARLDPRASEHRREQSVGQQLDPPRGPDRAQRRIFLARVAALERKAEVVEALAAALVRIA